MSTSKLDLLFGVILAAAGAGLLLGLYAGLIRMGLALPAGFDPGGMAHGPLMINGFLATLISLERGAALQKWWSYVAPLALIVSTVLLLSGAPQSGGFFLLLGSAGLVIIMGYLCYLQPVAHHVILAAGAAALLTGNILFVSNIPMFELVGWWAAFPMLTIFGERLELNRIMRPPRRARQGFAVLLGLWIVFLAALHVQRDTAWLIASVLLILIAAWLIRYDVARRTIRSAEWTRYSAWGLLTGYGWLIVAGITGIIYGLPQAGYIYDAVLHIIFVGFVFSMIFAHAAIVIPALTGKTVPWSRYFYLPFILLHGFLLVRVAGDLLYLPGLREIGSYGNTAAILLFLGGVLISILFRTDTPKAA